MQKQYILQVGQIDGASTLAQVVPRGIELLQTDTAEDAISILLQNTVALVFLDLALDTGMFLKALQTNKTNLPVYVCGTAQQKKDAVKAMRLGAADYLPTPLDKRMLAPLLENLAAASNDDWQPIAGDEQTLDLLAQAKQFAQSPATVLLRGESGTGKEVFSKYIHLNSPRLHKPFIAVNCAAIPEALLESELFGHEKGAFSGAVAKKLGKFQQADQGTLLLDEISEMDLALQAKLLRAIQEKVVDPVGSSEPVPVDIRLIATTNRNLEDFVAEGRFREDLYFRLNVVSLEIPALRERPGDIVPLATFFLERYAQQNNMPAPALTPDAQDKLEGCYWKGNVRELENTLHRAVLLAGGQTELTAEHIVLSPMSLKMMDVPANNQAAAQSAEQTLRPHLAGAAAQHYAAMGQGNAKLNTDFIGKSLNDVEKEHILSTLNYCRGNREHAADVLGISIQILREKLAFYAAE